MYSRRRSYKRGLFICIILFIRKEITLLFAQKIPLSLFSIMKFALMTLALAATVFASPTDIEARARTFPERSEPNIPEIMT